jgi:uncharacterized protein (TIGR04255 family)
VTENTTREMPDYENPPVIEVVSGVAFKAIDRLLAPHLGLLWEKFKPAYPGCRELPPLVLQIEEFGPAAQVEAQLLQVPPLPRIWFIDPKGNKIIQVQRDRFIHNWKKVEPSDDYPRFPVVVSEIFRTRLTEFQHFLDEHQLGTVEPLQYELTYINHIPQGENWTSLRDVGQVFSDVSWDSSRDRFLPEPETIHWKTSFQLPERSGRLHVSIRSAHRLPDKTPLLVLELTARGIGQDHSLDGVWAWFQTAREWIVRAFADLADDQLQQTVWGRKP